MLVLSRCTLVSCVVGLGQGRGGWQQPVVVPGRAESTQVVLPSVCGVAGRGQALGVVVVGGVVVLVGVGKVPRASSWAGGSGVWGEEWWVCVRVERAINTQHTARHPLWCCWSCRGAWRATGAGGAVGRIWR